MKAEKLGRAARAQLGEIADACYSKTGSELDWLSGVAQTVGATLDQGQGVAAWTFRLDTLTPVDTCAADAAITRVLQQTSAEAPPEQAWRFLLGRRVSSASERLGLKQGLGAAFRTFREHGLEDFSALTVYDASGVGVAVASPVPHVFKTARSLANRLERIGAHLLTGFRLRRGLPEVDAVFSPDGKLLDASADARSRDNAERLRGAVRAFDRACSRLVPDADEALEAWQALVSGRWSIAQSSESDGRRYLIATRNAPKAIPRAALSPLESQALILRAQGLSFKIVAYELGLSETTACQLVQRGKRKLGVRSEAEIGDWLRLTMTANAGCQTPP